MASYSWASPISGDWISAANWSPAAVPNDPTANVTIDNPTLAPYMVSIGTGEFWTVNSLTMNNVNDLAGSNRVPYTAAALDINGTLNFGAGSAGTLGGSLQTLLFMNNGTILNPGTINAFVQGTGNVLLTGTNGLYITNWLQAAGGVVTIDTKSIAEMTGNTLFDGIFEAQGLGGVVNLGGPRQNLIVNIATIEGPPTIPNGWTELILNGTLTEIGEWNGTGYVGIESTLTEIGARGTVDVLNGRNYITPHTLTIQPTGLLNLSAGTVTTGGIDINGGTVQGAGNINSGVINNGTLRALDGTLTVGTGGLVGTGLVSFDYDQKFGTVSATGAVMEVHGVGPGQTFVMNGDDTLVIDTPVSFAGTIDAKVGDKILLGGVGASSATLSGDTLNLQNAAGQTVYALHMGGNYTGDSFALTPLGGGTSSEIQVKGPLASLAGGTSATSDTAAITPASLTAASTSSVFTNTASVTPAGPGSDTQLDANTTSSFVIAASGDQTFVMDVRNPTVSTFSTIANFHSGDTVKILGLSLSDFTVNLYNDVGAPGYTGLAFALSSPGHPTVNLVLSGYSTADLTNGRLSQAFGTVTDPSATPYLTIHAT
ncbi:MAG TPA: hypothetical protein PLD10_04515 [Rhodopila sp.]|nr:hypothetical protein [Rhodopila sp.]